MGTGSVWEDEEFWGREVGMAAHDVSAQERPEDPCHPRTSTAVPGYDNSGQVHELPQHSDTLGFFK